MLLKLRHRLFHAGLAAAGIVLGTGAWVSAQQPDQRTLRVEGLAQWKAVESVLTHPRCVNCHTSTEYPRQTDDRRPHQFRVARGKDDKGVPGAMCSSCHQEQNTVSGGPPGAPNWHLAPLSMAWERAPGVTMMASQLCRTLLDRRKNGNRDVAALIEHMANDKLVLWAWAPGASPSGEPRARPPLAHEQFTGALNAWAQAGAPCPD
jgi:hypothetical protein